MELSNFLKLMGQTYFFRLKISKELLYLIIMTFIFIYYKYKNQSLFSWFYSKRHKDKNKKVDVVFTKGKITNDIIIIINVVKYYIDCIFTFPNYFGNIPFTANI